MQYGIVNDDVEADIILNVLDDHGESIPIACIIDTGATGDMTLPQSVIHRLNLPLAEDPDNIGVALADGSSSPGRLYIAVFSGMGSSERLRLSMWEPNRSSEWGCSTGATSTLTRCPAAW